MIELPKKMYLNIRLNTHKISLFKRVKNLKMKTINKQFLICYNRKVFLK